MLIINFGSNKSNRWNRNKKKDRNKDKKEEGGGGRGAVEFRVSFINQFKTKRFTWVKESCSGVRCLNVWDFLSFLMCSSILVLKW